MLALVATGLTNDEIAEHLFITPFTVKTGIASIGPS
ncbi:LuxR C-terminal-related transcriptional regulator [Streptomyces sp. NBC_00444]